MNEILILQITAHVLADFFFQRSSWVNEKETKFVSKSHFIHAFIVFLTSYVLSFQFQFILVSFAIATLHLLVDIGKTFFLKRFNKDLFFVDQAIHILAIFLIIRYLTPQNLLTLPFCTEQKYPGIMLGYLLCLKPANLSIRKIFEIYSIKMPPGGLPNAGRLIGNVERMLTLTFMLTGNYEVVGFIIASKSILRFKETDTLTSEYVLVGTLLSFGIAVLTGMLLKLQFQI